MYPAADDDFLISRSAPYGQVLVLPSQRLMRAMADDDFLICQNATYEQVLVFPSRRLVHPAADDFVLRKDLKKHFSTNSKFSQTCTEKQIMSMKATVNWLFSDTWRYLVIGCFPTIVRVY